jgi:hypothetical protein
MYIRKLYKDCSRIKENFLIHHISVNIPYKRLSGKFRNNMFILARKMLVTFWSKFQKPERNQNSYTRYDAFSGLINSQLLSLSVFSLVCSSVQ